jgi:malate dehydrogenase (oxaloacetate-decarboxylating)
LDVRATRITTGMQMAAADALSELVGDEVAPDYIVPSVFDKRVAGYVAEAVVAAARAEGVARV